METPYTDHLTTQDFEHVYEPAEDSFLLLDALEDDLNYLQQLQPRVCLEIGSGSGIIITALAKQFPEALCLATDINGNACRITKSTAQRNDALVEAVRCNLVDALRPQNVDVLLFNPPYVVTSDEELQPSAVFADKSTQHTLTERNLVYSWAGGTDGRRVTDALLARLDTVLSPQGVFYLLVLRENKPEELVKKLHEMGFEAIKFKERRVPGEYLYILKIKRKNK